MEYGKREKCIIWLDSFNGLEYRHKREILSVLLEEKDSKKAIEKCRAYIVDNLGEACYNTILNSLNSVYLQYVEENLARSKVKAITIESTAYPERLKNTPIPPLVLYVRGNESLLDSKIFGMVGSRKSLPLSINIAKEFAKTLVESNFTVITGIAEGVDSSVIEWALNCGGKAISVVAGGLNHIYPSSNTALAERVAEKGLLVAEYPPDIKPDRYMFPVRNRIIAGLADGVLIVSGRKKSGTLYTAEYAEEYGKDLFAIPYSVGIESGEGCNDLIKRGAMLCDSPSDILDYYGVKKQEKIIALSPDELKVIEILKNGEQHIEEISRMLNRATYEVQTTLSVLEIKGVIARNGVNIYGLICK